MASTETKVKRGFKAPCPKCGEENVQVYLADISTLRCPDCEEDIDLADVRALVAGWTAVLAWLDTAPICEE